MDVQTALNIIREVCAKTDAGNWETRKQIANAVEVIERLAQLNDTPSDTVAEPTTD